MHYVRPSPSSPSSASSSPAQFRFMRMVGIQIFGAFCSDSWQVSDKYYGTGGSFLYKVPTHVFSVCPDDDDDPSLSLFRLHSSLVDLQLYPKKAFYLWTGVNNYVQLSGEDFISVGGGSGTMGLWLNDDLSFGSSQSCDTFANEPLASAYEHPPSLRLTLVSLNLSLAALQGGVQRAACGGVGFRRFRNINGRIPARNLITRGLKRSYDGSSRRQGCLLGREGPIDGRFAHLLEQLVAVHKVIAALEASRLRRHSPIMHINMSLVPNRALDIKRYVPGERDEAHEALGGEIRRRDGPSSGRIHPTASTPTPLVRGSIS